MIINDGIRRQKGKRKQYNTQIFPQLSAHAIITNRKPIQLNLLMQKNPQNLYFPKMSHKACFALNQLVTVN